ncbi:hypothetical protein ACH5RR_039920 [Cinchona calisaya]|uniref:Reverse transcriptase domain-containing protein n=1 Tax=Cinchona calisaya TaxID=153742 RepID=A0ABD2Y315_9GENT
MHKISFKSIWIKWVMACVTSVSYSFNLNGSKIGYIKPFRGLRQEDPLFPHLFILCAECFSNLINQASRDKQRTSLKFVRMALASHAFSMLITPSSFVKQLDRKSTRLWR